MTLDDIRAEARPFPTWALQGHTAACFFAAGFLGYNAEIHVLDAGMTALCIDSDAVKLKEMRKLYPLDWTFVDGDAYALLEHLQGRVFDVVIADPPLGEMVNCHARLDEFRAISRRVILGTTAEIAATAPNSMQRTGEAWWAIW